jgi:hypothetical protein
MTENTSKRRLLERFVALAFFLSVFIFFCHPIKLGDFWWHIASGKWILEHGKLPSEEPFAYTYAYTSDNRERTDLSLKGYWISQTGYFLIYKYAGFRGLVIFNAAFFTLIIYVLWITLRHYRTDPYASLLLLVPVVILFQFYDEIRPQNFSFLFTLLIFLCIERGLENLKTRPGRHPRPFILMPLIMLFWVNMHQGFVIGLFVLGTYVLSETLSCKFGSETSARKAGYRKFLLWSSLTLAASLVNPNFINLQVTIIKELGVWSHLSIIEFATPWKYSEIIGAPHFFYTLVFLFVLTLTIMSVSWRRLKLPHVILFSVFAIAAMYLFRLGMFFIIMSVAVSAAYASSIEKSHLRKFRIVMALLVMTFSVFLVIKSFRAYNFSQGPVNIKYLPVKAVNFIAHNNLPQPLFNPYAWGGYISWRLNPQYKVFIDARPLDLEVAKDYQTLKLGVKKDLFKKYGIRTAIFYPIYFLDGKIQAIVLSLLKDRDWNLVYCDEISSIFVRADSSTGLSSIDKRHHWNALIMYAKSEIRRDPESDKGYLELASIYSAMERWDEARDALKLAEKLKK